jgi:hypothetical protein
MPRPDPEVVPDGAPELESMEEPEDEPVEPSAAPVEVPEYGLPIDPGDGPPSFD